MKQIEDTIFTIPSPLQKLEEPLFDQYQVQVWLKRDDLIHPFISGNKWRKLKYNLKKAREMKCSTLLTFGGAYSNHLYATAAAGKIFDFRTIGIVRGEEHLPLNETLESCAGNGMELHYMSRGEYRIKNSQKVLDYLKEKFGPFYLIPEGGSNMQALAGTAEIVDEINLNFDYILTAVGTGGTLAGIVTRLQPHQRALGISVLKGGNFLNDDVNNLTVNYKTIVYNNFKILTKYHFGGYAKYTDSLLEFIQEIKERHNIPLDRVYTGKVFYAAYDLIMNGLFEKDSRIIILHTGGYR